MRKLTENNPKQSIKNVLVGQNVKINDFVNLYGCKLGDNCMIGPFVEIQNNVKIGRRCRIQSHSFICSGVTIEKDVFIGHNVTFINDKCPSVENALKKTWKCLPTLVREKAVIGSGAIILGGITIGKGAFIGAGSVVTKDIPAGVTVVGIPAKPLKDNLHH
ncbi:MAG: acyltransferase [Patescibacteria group bacterium]|nr:acyltransferase [Patescibacteria group bacterium]